MVGRLALLHARAADLTPALRRALAADARDYSRRVFDGAPLQFEVYDDAFQDKKVISTRDET